MHSKMYSYKFLTETKNAYSPYGSSFYTFPNIELYTFVLYLCAPWRFDPYNMIDMSRKYSWYDPVFDA